MSKRTAAARTGAGIPSVPGVEDLEKVATGGFGEVYRGRQPDLDREVAVKVVLSQARQADVERWRKEITAMGRLSNHPNIVGVYSAGLTDDGLPYLVMPFVPGGSLQQRLDASGPLSPDAVASLGAKLAAALSAAHSVGVLHRDVKPDNVLLSPYGEPQLTDLGIARLVDTTTTVSGPVHATVRYAAPEVLSGEPASEASDIYSLGATLFAALTGAPPYAGGEGDSVVALVGRIANDELPDLRDHGATDLLASALERALHKSPRQRFGAAAELQAALESAAGAADPMSRPPGTDTTQAAPTVEAAAPTVMTPGTSPTVASRPRTDHPEPVAHSSSSDRPRPNFALPLAIAVLAIGLAGLLFVVSRPDGGAPAGDPAPADQADPRTAQSPGPEGQPAEAEAISSRAVDYFEAISAGNLDSSYSMLSPEFRRRQSQADYESFWSSVGPVRIAGPATVDASRRVAVVPLTIDGRREDFRLTFVRSERGIWYVDGPRPG